MPEPDDASESGLPASAELVATTGGEVPARPPRPRDPGDAWVDGERGRFWGRFGAAGLLVVDRDDRVLLQHRVEWSHFGGTWGLPGGARHEHEAALDGALREAGEETGVPADALAPIAASVLDLGYWSYTTVIARAVRPFEARIGDAESTGLAWVPVADVPALPLHPGLAASWDELAPLLAERLVVVVDAANVVGSRPDGWWRDRAGAAERLLASLERLAAAGIPAPDVNLPLAAWWPRVMVVLEGRARAARPAGAAAQAGAPVEVVRAAGSGDDAIVEVVADLLSPAAEEHADALPHVVVVTSDAELRQRTGELGAHIRGAGWLLALLEREPADGR